MAKKNPALPKYLLLVCLAFGVIFDLLFWGKPLGISFPLFTLLLVVGGLLFARQAGVKPAPRSLWLLAPLAFFALMFIFRAEPLTLFTSWAAAVACLALFAITFAGGQWPHFGFADHLARLLSFLPQGALALRDSRQPSRKQGKPSTIAAVLRGLLLALPLLVVLGLLLSSADVFFADWMQSIFGAFSFDKGPEYLFRVFLVVLVGITAASAYAYALVHSKRHKLLGENQPLVKPLLGFGEAATMLASVNLLFAVFVAVQFRYFFGGLANIVEGPSGLTFADYARRGFGELVLVAVISLVFYMGLSAVTARLRGRQQGWFSGLGIFLFAMVAVMLVSAFQRLLLLEEAYGFTRLRTYPHVFMVWLGLLLLAIVVLEALHRQRAFALAVLTACVGFTATLGVMNVDSFIAFVNIDRAKAGAELDHRYLGTLSDDAAPVLVREYYAARSAEDAELANQLEVALACHFASRAEATEDRPWQSFSLSATAADKAWEQLTANPDFPDVEFLRGSLGTDVSLNGEAFACYSSEF